MIATLAMLALCFAAWWCFVEWFCDLSLPEDLVVSGAPTITVIDSDTYTTPNGWIKKTESGFWELYIEGEPYQRGLTASVLFGDALAHQEQAFVSNLSSHVPAKWKQNLLLQFARYYNRHIDDYIPHEYQHEIAGVSQYADSSFSYIGNNYGRKLIYHGAHDIGHAFQNMGLVSGCTSFGARDSAGHVLLGRNFDFYVGDGFAKNKVILAVKPENGYPFISVTWPGFMGVVSGMNTEGLCVALNAGPSLYPGKVKTPVTILAREIVQYASNLSDAIAIAEKRDVFVAENIIVGHQDSIIVIEKKPGSTIIYRSIPDQFACSNHFLSDENHASRENQDALRATSTGYRLARIKELSAKRPEKTIKDMIDILRNRDGLNDTILGNGNEQAINILIGHHSVVFDLTSKSMTVAGRPSQIATAYQYNVSAIFDSLHQKPQPLWFDTIAADPFYYTQEYKDYELFKIEKNNILNKIAQIENIPITQINAFSKLNARHYQTYDVLGDYFHSISNDSMARVNYLKALSMPIPWATDRKKIKNKINSAFDQK